MKDHRKTILQWLETLQKPYRDRAIANCKCQYGSARLEMIVPCLNDAIDQAMLWDRTPEGHDYWENIQLNPKSFTISAEGKSPEASKPTHNPMHKYADQPVATPTLVFGTDVSDLNAQACISTIVANNAEIKKLTDTGIESPYITKQVEGLKAANAALGARLDSFA